MTTKGKDTHRAMGQLTADNPMKAGPTIVGGQPPARGRDVKGVPVGMERVIFLAAMEPAFRDALLEDGADRQAVVEDRGLEMQPSEAAMLKFVPASQLQANIDGVDTSEDNVERRTFLRAVAAGAMAITSAEAFTGCDGATDGSRPDDLGPPPVDATGIRPDRIGYDSAGLLSDWPIPPDDQAKIDMGSRPNDSRPPDWYKPGEDGKVDVPAPALDATGIRPGKDGSR